MKLRDYQLACIEAIHAQYESVKSTLYVLPTGAGKTIVFASVINEYAAKGRVMVLAHREELIDQAARKIQQVTGEKPDIEMGDRWADRQQLLGGRAKVVVSSIQTQISGCRGAGRMTRFRPEEFSLVVVDEIHHATAGSYQKVLAHYRQNPALRVLGCTATPDRADEEALGQVCETCAFEYEIQDAIQDGWLVPIRQRMVFIEGLDFSSVHTTAGDLNGAELGEVMEEEENLHAVAHPTFELAGKRKTIVFCVRVAQAERMAEILNRHETGCARAVSGKTSPEDRREIFAHFSEGRFRFLVNVGVTTEGYDEPTVECIAMARPTKSRSLFAQMIGRATRPLAGILDEIDDAPGRRVMIDTSAKPFCEVIDFVGNSGNHKLIHATDVLGGKCSDRELEIAEKIVRESAVPLDVNETIELAKKKAEAERVKAEDEAKRAHIKGLAKYNTKALDPFAALDIEPMRARGWDSNKSLSQKQRTILERQKIDPDSIPYHEATQILGAYFKHCMASKSRTGEWGCSLKQMNFLRKYGINPEGLSIKEASAHFDTIKANGWKRPVQAMPVEAGPW